MLDDNKKYKKKLQLRVEDSLWQAFQGLVPRNKTSSQVISELIKEKVEQKKH